ncbi:MAG TPA: hypothetical protein VNM69_00475 [Bacillus sp. (in: firmicutes)]|uniref:hypothetical protein n=1 Tax=Bacillus litorisediminis TaxID=2922713 RepID=UPI001FAEE2A2|nr:hypothetical protein [Bacillus litorisediminis]HWO74370.1 hypothetical protein [Bacillus sp. (in: firmicutes)]
MENLREQYAKQIEKEVRNYRKAYDKLKNSDDPRMQGKDVQDYEVRKLQDAMETKVRELESEFKTKIDEQIEAQERVAARSSFYVSQADKQFISELTKGLTAELMFASNEADKVKAIREFEGRLEHFESEAPFSEVVKQLPEVVSKLGDDEFSKKKLRGIYHTLRSGLQTPEQAELEALKEAKKQGVSRSFRNLRMTHPTYSHLQKARKTNTNF